MNFQPKLFDKTPTKPKPYLMAKIHNTRNVFVRHVGAKSCYKCLKLNIFTYILSTLFIQFPFHRDHKNPASRNRTHYKYLNYSMVYNKKRLSLDSERYQKKEYQLFTKDMGLTFSFVDLQKD